MKGSVRQRCYCRDPETRKELGARCPRLGSKGHGKWFYRLDVPVVPGEARRQPRRGPYATKRLAEEEMAAEIGRLGGGAPAADRSLTVRDYLAQWLAARKLRLKPRSYESYEEAVRLYFSPALGHLRLADLRDWHLQELVAAMMQVNRPLPESDKQSETLRRLTLARADDVRRVLPEGEGRHKKSKKPLSPARIEREFAVMRAALNDAVPRKLLISPYEGVELPRVQKVRPLAWTPEREAAFRGELAVRIRDAEAAAEAGHRVLTTVERQEIWSAADLRPSSVMVWLPGHVGEFLDYLDDQGERLSVLFLAAAYCGFRRDEVIGLKWADVSLEAATALVIETGSGNGPKSAAGVRSVSLPGVVTDALRAWRKVQVADQLAWAEAWSANGLVFTREDGAPVPAQWTSNRFELLAYRCGLPPVRFHDLRHGTASMAKAAGHDTKVISSMLGHSRTSFTDATYVTLFADVERTAAEATAAVVPRRPRRKLGSA